MSNTAEVPQIKPFKVGTEGLDIDWMLKHPFDDVHEASEKLPAAMAWLGWQRAWYKELLYNAEVAVKTAKGTVYHHYRAEGFESDGFTGKPTEAAIEHAINVHPDVIAQHGKVAKYEGVISKLTTYICALEHKIDLVRTGEATHRKVVENEPPTDEEIENMAHAKSKGE